MWEDGPEFNEVEDGELHEVKEEEKKIERKKEELQKTSRESEK